MRKIVTLLLLAAIICSFTCNTYAFSDDSLSDGFVNVAYIKSIDNTGSNIGTDVSNPTAIQEKGNYTVSFKLESSRISFFGIYSDIPFSVSGNLITTNENGNLLLYDASDSTNNYTVAYVSVDRKLDETALFFVNIRDDNPTFVNVVKLYMQPKNTNSLILIEIFLNHDYVSNFLASNEVSYNSEAANRIQSWFVKYYGPIINDSNKPQPKSNIYFEEIDLSKTYNLYGSLVTFRFVIRLYYPVPDLGKGGSGIATCYFSVAESRTTSDTPAYNSSTQGYLRLEEMNVKFYNMPYVIFTSQEPLRSGIQNNFGSINLSFSLSFGISFGIISASGNLDFNQSKTMSTATVPLTYTNTSGTKGTESGILPSNLYMNSTGAYYGIRVVFMDAGNYTRSGTMGVTFDYLVNNMYNYADSYYDSYSDSFTINVS